MVSLRPDSQYTHVFFQTVPVVVMPKFDLVQFLELIQKYKVTLALIVPPTGMWKIRVMDDITQVGILALLLAKRPIVENYDLSSVRLFSSGAAPLSKELVEAVVSRIGVGVRQGYGMTEMSPTSHVLRYNDWKVYGSIGPLLANLECKIVDEEDNSE
jgi:4-coumarate--CoA ligase